MLGSIFDKSKVLEKSLDAAWLRNETISQNIANVDTPGYKRKTVAFEEYLQQALDDTKLKIPGNDSGQIPVGGQDIDNVEIRVTEDNSSLSTRLDGNNVDIDSEAASLAKNTIKYNTLVESLNAGFRRLKSVISEGRK